MRFQFSIGDAGSVFHLMRRAIERFQFSIGDAFVDVGFAQDDPGDTFQFSIGDADVAGRL